MKRFLKAFLSDDGGATAVEYGLILALICVAVMGVAGTLGKNIAAKFTLLSTKVNTAGG